MVTQHEFDPATGVTTWHHNGGDPGSLIHGYGFSPEAAEANFWENVFLEAEQARQRNGDPMMPLSMRNRQALSLIGEQPLDHTGEDYA